MSTGPFVVSADVGRRYNSGSIGSALGPPGESTMKTMGRVLFAVLWTCAVGFAATACGGSPSTPTPPTTHTLNVTLVQGYELSGPYWWTLTGPSGFTCSLGATQQNVSCSSVSFAAGTSVILTVTNLNPAFEDVRIINGQGCDSITKYTCTVAMNENKTVSIRVSSPI
jgi:hypothetical protein